MNVDHTFLPATTEMGSLGVFHLKRYWARQCAVLNQQITHDHFPDEWPLDNFLFNTLGIGIEQTLRFIFREKPGFDEFENWILQLNNGCIDKARIDEFNSVFNENAGLTHQELSVGVLGKEELQQWQQEGYVIIRNAVSAEDCEATVSLIESYLAIDRQRPDTWYTEHPQRNGIMVELYQHPQLERNRRSPRIVSAYEQLWKQKGLHADAGKTGFSPPHRPGIVYPVSRLHWDVSLQLPIPFGTQGILYLNDTTESGGALRVVPGFHNKITEWLQQLPEDVNPRDENLEKLGTRSITAGAGDFVIWHHALPHAAGINQAATPRFVQYINYTPAIMPIQSLWV